MKDLKDMSSDELTDYCTWRFIETIVGGMKLRSAIWQVIDLALMWKKRKEEK